MGEIYGSIYGGISKVIALACNCFCFCYLLLFIINILQVLANITQRMQRDRRRERVVRIIDHVNMQISVVSFGFQFFSRNFMNE